MDQARNAFPVATPINKTDGAHQTYQLTLVSLFGYSGHAPAEPGSPVQPEQSIMHSVLTVLGILVQIVLIAALADFIAGMVHWVEDAYFSEDTPIIGPLFIRPNIVHHHHPRFFTQLTWWQSSRDLLLFSIILLLAAWPLGLLSWQLGLFAVISTNANQVHKWAHRTRAENGRIISALQDWWILQTPRHHGLHHSDPKNTYYCPVTNLVNPVLERIDFWTRVESVIERLTGIAHRHDTAIRGNGPGPAWLAGYLPVSSTRKTPPPSRVCTGSGCRSRPTHSCATTCATRCSRHPGKSQTRTAAFRS
jgi:ubiquitin-conjugating enzyme E2 variant